ncbi:25405_t:CDS:1, partial [Dentiscutata erythropus]
FILSEFGVFVMVTFSRVFSNWLTLTVFDFVVFIVVEFLDFSSKSSVISQYVAKSLDHIGLDDNVEL